MIEELFHVGPISISPFGVLLVVAFFSAYWQLRRNLEQGGLSDDEDASAILLAAGLGGIAGGKIYYAALYHDWALLIDRAGIVWYGGFFGGALAALWVFRRRKLPIAATLDAAAPALALGYGLGRIGCFLVGDDYGVPTDLPWGVAFPVGRPPTTAGVLREEFGATVPAEVSDDQLLAVHPTQLYETALGLAIWGVGMVLLRRGLKPGTTFLVVLALLSAERFGIELLRAKDDRFLGPLTVAQGIAAAIFAVAVLVLAARRRPAAA